MRICPGMNAFLMVAPSAVVSSTGRVTTPPMLARAQQPAAAAPLADGAGGGGGGGGGTGAAGRGSGPGGLRIDITASAAQLRKVHEEFPMSPVPPFKLANQARMAERWDEALKVGAVYMLGGGTTQRKTAKGTPLW
jgi:hypothetical protein